MADKQKPRIQTLLEKLQEESWQLELLISGFAIFLVAAIRKPVRDFMRDLQVASMGLEGDQLFNILIFVALASWFFLLANLILHVLLRGLWIGAIGLRYISGDINFDKLNLESRFDRFLRKRIPSFDLYIEQLERLCSAVFAFTFLIIFALVALGMFVASTQLIVRFLSYVSENWLTFDAFDHVRRTILFIWILAWFIYFLDFVTLGWIKRRKMISKVYYPFYRLFSWITLSFIYRPLYYNLIDQKFGRRLLLFMLPYMFLIGIVLSMDVTAFKYFPQRNGIHKLNDKNYLEHLGDENIIDEPIIPSRFVATGFLEVFVPYVDRDDQAIDTLCPGLRPDKRLGTKTTMIQFTGDDLNPSPVDSLLLCVQKISRVKIDDSLYQEFKPRFYVHPNRDEHGLLGVLDVQHLSRGEHLLRIEKQRVSSDSLTWTYVSEFPFWKE